MKKELKNCFLSSEIKKTTNLMLQKYKQLAKDTNEEVHISRVQGIIINYLAKNEDKEIFQNDVEKFLSIRASSTTEHLKAMEKNKLIKRVACKEDARKKQIILTDKAYNVLNFFKERTNELDAAMCKNLTNREKDNFLKILFKIQNSLR